MKKIVLYLLISSAVLYAESKLQWQHDIVDLEMIFEEAISYCEELELGDSNDWRVPSLVELTELSENIELQESPEHYFFWTSTIYVGFTRASWFVSFNENYQHFSLKTNKHYVRCTRTK